MAHRRREIAREPNHRSDVEPADKAVNLDRIIEVDMILRGASSREDRHSEIHKNIHVRPKDRQFHDVASAADRHGALAEDLEIVRGFAARFGLTTKRVHRVARGVSLTGRMRDFEEAFGVQFLRMVRHTPLGEFHYHSHRNPVSVPLALDGIVEAVVGLDSRRSGLGSHRVFSARGKCAASAVHAAAETYRYLAEHYQFPAGQNGRGRRIAIIELGGGFHPSDLASFFRAGGGVVPDLRVLQVSPTARNNPSPRELLAQAGAALESGDPLPHLPEGELARLIATFETTMDIQIAGALASGAALDVYFAPQSNAGMYQALATAIESPFESPDIVSLSWSGPETDFEPSDRLAIDAVIEAAALRGITICCSSGDAGDGRSAQSEEAEVTYPSANPFVLSCGGTHVALGKAGGVERVWNESPNAAPNAAKRASGGGFSRFYQPPPWQAHVQRAALGRGVPDVAAKADVHGGLPILVGGRLVNAGGGTSASTPIWAALLARIAEGLNTRLGCVGPLFYQPEMRHRAFADILEGSNGAFHASPGWDPCTGWGAPRGSSLLDVLAGAARRAHAG